MCVICHKPANVRFPERDVIEAMWDANKDGAGVMWRDGDVVRWKKGFMRKDDFFTWFDKNRKKLEATECALHFRITTHGGTNQGNCHPFPCFKGGKPHALKGKGKFVLMHNGIMPLVPRSDDLSDTAEYALRAQESGDPVRFLKATAEFVGMDSRMVMFAPATTWFVGKWEKRTPDDGCQYSNLNFDMYSDYGFSFGSWRPKSSKPKPKDVVDPANKRGFDPDRNDYGYDIEHDRWFDWTGRTVDFREVDPDGLCPEDYDLYWALYNDYEFAGMCDDEEADRALYGDANTNAKLAATA